MLSKVTVLSLYILVFMDPLLMWIFAWYYILQCLQFCLLNKLYAVKY